MTFFNPLCYLTVTQEVLNGAEPLDADDVFAELEKKQTASGN